MNNIRKIALTGLLIVASLTHQLFGNTIANKDIHIFFDMNGVLVETVSATRLLDPRLIMQHIFYDRTNPFTLKNSLKTKLYQLFKNINPHQVDDARDEHGAQLPQVLCDWQKGLISSGALLDLINVQIDQHCTFYQGKLLKSIVNILLCPTQLPKTQIWHTNMVDFAKELHQAGYTLHILSNWDKESFAVMKQVHPEVFTLFDKIIISADIGLLKPGKEIFEYVLNKYNLDCNHCFFIDDQPKNVQAAKQVGFKTASCPSSWFSAKHDVKKVKKEFYAWRKTVEKNPSSTLLRSSSGSTGEGRASVQNIPTIVSN